MHIQHHFPCSVFLFCFARISSTKNKDAHAHSRPGATQAREKPIPSRISAEEMFAAEWKSEWKRTAARKSGHRPGPARAAVCILKIITCSPFGERAHMRNSIFAIICQHVSFVSLRLRFSKSAQPKCDNEWRLFSERETRANVCLPSRSRSPAGGSRLLASSRT